MQVVALMAMTLMAARRRVKHRGAGAAVTIGPQTPATVIPSTLIVGALVP